MKFQYRLKEPVYAISQNPKGKYASVTLPAGAVLRETSQPSSSLFRMMGVYWEGRHYHVHRKDLLLKAERVAAVG